MPRILLESPSSRRLGSRLFAAGVMVVLRWMFGLLQLRLALVAALTALVKIATG